MGRVEWGEVKGLGKHFHRQSKGQAGSKGAERVCVWKSGRRVWGRSLVFGHTEFARLVGHPGGGVQNAADNVSLELQKEAMAGDADLGTIFVGDG